MVHEPMSGLQGRVEAATSAFAPERLQDAERSGGGIVTNAAKPSMILYGAGRLREPAGRGGVCRQLNDSRNCGRQLWWNLSGGAGTSFGWGGWRLWSGAEPACHGRRGFAPQRPGLDLNTGGGEAGEGELPSRRRRRKGSCNDFSLRLPRSDLALLPSGRVPECRYAMQRLHFDHLGCSSYQGQTTTALTYLF